MNIFENVEKAENPSPEKYTYTELLWTERVLPNLYVEVLRPNVMVFGSRAFGRLLGLLGRSP